MQKVSIPTSTHFSKKVFEAKRRLIEVDEEVTPAKIKLLMLGGKFNKKSTC